MTAAEQVHSPGPWTLNGRAVEMREGLDRWRLVCFDENDARLIASAPDLLAACEAYLAYLDDDSDVDVEHFRRTEALMRAAVLKARGLQSPLPTPVWAKDEPPIDTESPF